ncbi:MAG TPA: hypothetical protein PKM25_10290, partial [Candidatus Ozemobacteraceae bacterium]|nr:hypothetical protein [Candidatus Ozemobacteraceae bacterium]
VGTVENAGTGWSFAGHFDSAVFDSRSSSPNWDRMLYDVTSGGGRFSFYTRTGDTPNPNDPGWDIWQPLALDVNANNAAPGTLIASPDKRYLQYRCVFQKAAAGNTPTLNKVSISCGSLKIEQVTANTPDGVSQGQNGIPVSVRIKNDTPVAITLSSLQLSFSLGSYTELLSSPILGGSIAAGIATYATFTVDVWPASPLGTATIHALATGTGGGFTYSDIDADQPHVWRVLSKAALQIVSADTTPVFVNKGQTAKVRLNLMNTGEAPFLFTGATMTFDIGTYTVTLQSPSSGFEVGGLGSMTATFSVFVRPESPSGVANINGTASGTNKLSGAVTDDASATFTDSWTIQSPAEFFLQSVVASSVVYRGQVNTPVKLTVKNTGEAVARWQVSDILSYFTLGNYDDVYPRTTISVAQPVEIYGGLATSVTYGVDINPLSVTGTSSVDAKVMGIDGNQPELDISDEFAAFPATWTILAEKIKTYKDPACQIEWSSFNRPTTGALMVYAKGESLAPFKEFVIHWLDSIPSEVGSTSPPLTSDASGTMVHQYALTSASNYGAWTVRITNPLNTVVSCENTFEVVKPASLTVALSLPSKVTVGQSFNATMTFYDIGGADITSAKPSVLATGGTGIATLTDAPDPSYTQDVVSGDAATFSWTFRADAAGTFIATGSGFGNDANSEELLQSASATSNTCLFQAAPVLTIPAISETYTTVYRNQTGLVVLMGVKNAGQADAVIEAASLSFDIGTHTQTLISALPYTLAGGTAATFTFNVTVDAESPVGNVTITGSFLAHDGNHPNVLYAASGGTGAWIINAVRGICAANTTFNPEQYTFTKGQTVNARFLNLPLNTKFLIRFYNAETGGTLVKTSPPINSLGAGVCDDQWILATADANTLPRKWRVHIENDLDSNAGTFGTIYGLQYFEVQNPPQIVASLTLTPGWVFIGETITATMVASNTIATGATVSPATPS